MARPRLRDLVGEEPDQTESELAQTHLRASVFKLVEDGVNPDIADIEISDLRADLANRFPNVGSNILKSTIKKMMKTERQRVAKEAQDRESNVARGATPVDPTDYKEFAHNFIRENYHHSDCATLAYWQRAFYSWDGPRWRMRDKDEILGQLSDWLSYQFVTGEGGKVSPFKPNNAALANTMTQLEIATKRVNDQSEGWHGEAPVSDTRGLLSCNNGILDTASLKIYKHTPRLFNTSYVDASWRDGWSKKKFDYRKALKGSTFQKYLNDLIVDDPVQQRSLQQVTGYLLTDRTDLQKAFSLVGERRSGKGLFAKILEGLKPGQTGSMPSARFDRSFNLEPLIDKSLCVLPDFRIDPKRTNFAAIAEMLLQITGEDTQSVERKYIGNWVGQVKIRFLIISNSSPKLRDDDGVLSSRFIMFHTGKSFYGKEDINLKQKLLDDLDLIFLWGVMGLRDLNERGRSSFIQSEKQIAAARKTHAKMAPILAFRDAFLDVTKNSDDTVLSSDLQTTFRHWALVEMEMTGWTQNGFFKRLNGAEDLGIQRSKERKTVTRKDEHGNNQEATIQVPAYRGVRWKEGKAPTQENIDDWNFLLNSDELDEFDVLD